MGQGAGQAPGGAPGPKSEWVLGTGLLQPAHPQTPTGNCQAEVKDCFGFCFHGLESVFFFFFFLLRITFCCRLKWPETAIKG